MKVIIWLWNPGPEYEKTRHNVWHLCLDHLWNLADFSEFKNDSKFFWEISEWNIDWDKVILLKPMTFMNLSWKSLIALKNFYKMNNEDIIIVYDDKDMDFWKIRFRDEWSSWWHNWIKDITRVLWTEKFARIKIWIKNEKLIHYNTSDFVLSNFSKDEMSQLAEDIFFETENLLWKWINANIN